MPDEQDGDNVGRESNGEAPVDGQVQASRNESVPTAQNTSAPSSEIAKEIKYGEKWLIGIGLIGLVLNGLIALLYFGQLQEMVGAVGQTDDLSRNYRYQAMQIARLAQETHDLALAAGKQADASKVIAENAKVQTVSGKLSAKDAIDAANTATNTLHVSQGAYLSLGPPNFNTIDKRIEIRGFPM